MFAGNQPGLLQLHCQLCPVPQAGIRGQHEYPAQADYMSGLSGDDRAVSMASSLPIYSLQDVSRHNTAKDLWIVIDKEVFDVTGFQAEHPGGERILQKVAGRDATDKFLEYHDASILARYRERLQVGVLLETKAQEPKKGFLSRFFRS
jgi:cytochrome b involved in lipid metabolism